MLYDEIIKYVTFWGWLFALSLMSLRAIQVVTWLGSLLHAIKKQQLELNMEQQTGSELGKEYIKAVYCHSAYLTDMQSTSWEMLD